MGSPTATWPVPSASPEADSGGLRERKKRLMRQQLSDTATRMFLERGFDAVKVTEIAEACGVSEKTVFNYFPTKESLILDRLEGTVTSLRAGLADKAAPSQPAAMIRRFGGLIQATPSLRAYRSDMMDQFVAVAAGILAERAAMSAEDPEPQIAATALLGLWRIQFISLTRYLDGTRTPEQVRQAVTADVHRAARVIGRGLDSLRALTPGARPDV